MAQNCVALVYRTSYHRRPHPNHVDAVFDQRDLTVWALSSEQEAACGPPGLQDSRSAVPDMS
eukprot:3577231-Pyramimonas_sp.AAC.1